MSNNNSLLNGVRQGAADLEAVKDNICLLWAMLTNEEVDYYPDNRQKFCDAIRQKYSLTQSQIEKQIEMIERETRLQ